MRPMVVPVAGVIIPVDKVTPRNHTAPEKGVCGIDARVNYRHGTAGRKGGRVGVHEGIKFAVLNTPTVMNVFRRDIRRSRFIHRRNI